MHHLGFLLAGLVVVFLITGWFDDFSNYQLATLGAYICAVAGLTLLTGTSGQISLGHGALMAIGGYTVAFLQTAFAESDVTGLWVLPVSLLAGTVVTAIFGAIFGTAAARLHGPYLAGATLALGVALPSVTAYFAVFKGDQGLFVPFDPVPDWLGDDFSLEHWQAWVSLGAAAVTLFFLANLQRSAIGRHFRAVRDDEVAAELSGLHVPRLRILAFTISAAAAGLGGGVFAFVLQTASPGSFGLVLSLTLLSAVIIGGLGSLPGAVIGSVIVVYLGHWINEWVDTLELDGAWTTNLVDHLPNAVYGLLLILMMLLVPGGLTGLFRRLWVRRRSVHSTANPSRRSQEPAAPSAPSDPTPPPRPTPPRPPNLEVKDDPQVPAQNRPDRHRGGDRRCAHRSRRVQQRQRHSFHHADRDIYGAHQPGRRLGVGIGGRNHVGGGNVRGGYHRARNQRGHLRGSR